MIFNKTTCYAKVWKVTRAENGKYIDLRISTSEKNEDGDYKNSSWFPRVIGHAVNSLKNIKEGDRIAITSSKFTNEQKEDQEGNKKSFFRFLILEAKIEDGNSDNDSAKKTTTGKTNSARHEDDPWG